MIRLCAQATDDGSGVALMEIWIDSKPPVLATLTSGDRVCLDDIDLSAMAHGKHTVYVRATDKAGNVATTSKPFDLDITAPYFTTQPYAVPSDWTNASPIVINWVVSDYVSETDLGSGVDFCEVLVVNKGQLPTTEPPVMDWTKTTDNALYSLNVSGFDDGEYDVYVRATDKSGNVSAVSNPATFKFDQTDPTGLTLTADKTDWINQTTGGPVKLTFSADGSLSGISKYELKVDDGLVIDWFDGTSQHDLDVSGLADGTHTVYMRATDTAGNTNAKADWASVGIKLDKTPPAEFTPTADPSGWTNAAQIAITFGTTDAEGEAVRYDIAHSAYSATGVTSGHPVPTAGLADGEHTVTVTAVDAAGNKRDGTVTIYVDNSAPTPVIIAADPPSWTNEDTVSITFETTDLSALTYNIAVGGWFRDGVASPFTLSTQGVTDNFGPETALADGDHVVTVTAVDAAGNTREGTVTIYLDKTDPTIAITSATQDGGLTDLLDGDTAMQGLVTIVVTAKDETAGFDVLPTVSVAPSSGDALTISSAVDNLNGTFTYICEIIDTTANGTATINASATDKAGNSTAADEKTFTINKNQITGSVELEGLYPSDSIVRNVVFTATGTGAGLPKTWTLSLHFDAKTNTAAYVLTDVPEATTGLSAKTAWNLRRKITGLTAGGAAVASFTGSNRLLGGDINETNSINILDYGILIMNWNTANSVADIDGDGLVYTGDYMLMLGNWFTAGDPE